MNDDELMRAIAKAAQDDAANDTLDPRWDEVSRGTTTASAVELVSGERDPDVAAAFEPFDADFKAQLVSEATAALGSGGADTVASNVVALPARGKRNVLFALAASALLGIGLATTLLDRAPGGGGGLPTYSHSFRGTAELRSGDAGEQRARVRVDQTFEVALAPATAFAGAPQVRLFARTDRGEQPVPISDAQSAPTGALRVTGPAAALGDGPVTLVVVVADGTWPDATQRQAPGSGPTWQVIHVPVEVVGAAP